MRDPSIHIRRSKLFDILIDFGINDRDMPQIMLAASKISIKNRVNLVLSSKGKQKAQRVVDANTDIVEQFNLAYSTVMKEQSIKVLVIRKGNPQYLSFIEIAQQAKEFCDLFELDYMQGFLIYIRLGVTILNKKYSLYRLKSASDRIVDKFRIRMTIINDSSPLLTELMFQAWEKAVKKYFNAVIGVRNDTDKYVHFVYAKQDADEINANYDDWMCAQFEKWAFLNNMPEFSQLHGENAKLNYKIFMAKSIGSSTETKEEKQYFKAIEDGKKISVKKTVPIRKANQKNV